MQPTIAAPVPPPQSKRPWQVLAIVSAGVFMASLDVTIVNIAFPDIAADFAGTSLASLSWILNAYAIVFRRSWSPPAGWRTRSGASAGSWLDSACSSSRRRSARSRCHPAC